MAKIEAPSNDKYQTFVDTCLELYKTFDKSEYRAKKLTEIEKGIKRYEQDAPKTTYPWDKAYNIYLPLLAITIDNLEPRLVAGLTGRDPIISFGTNLKDHEQILEDWYNDELKTVVKVEDVARTFVHTILKEGTWYGVPIYDIDEKEMFDFTYKEDGKIVIDDNGSPQLRSAKETVFEGGDIKVLPFNDVRCADDLGTLEEWEEADKIVTIHPTYAELMQNKDKYMNIGPWLLSAKDQRKIKDKSPDQIVAGVDVSGKETIECLWCHVTFPTANLKEDPEDESQQKNFAEERIVATIAKASKTIIKFEYQRDLNMNNESLIKRGRLYPEEGRSFGTSMYGKMKSIQDGASDMFSLLMNIAVICMLPWYFFEEGSGVEGKQDIYPGAGVKVKDISKIKFPEFRINPRDYIDFIELWFQLWERIGGIADPQVGKLSTGDKTATEVLTVVEEGNIKHNYQASTFKEEFLDVFRTMYDLYYQYMPYDKTIEVDDPESQEEGKKIEMPFPRALMRRPEHLRLTGSTDKANKLIERKQNEDLYNTLRSDPIANPIKLVQDLIKSYGREDSEDYINPDIGQLVQMLDENPELMQTIMQSIQQFLEQSEGQEA